MYAVKLMRGYLASLAGLIGIAYGVSYLHGQSFAQTLPIFVGNPALFHMLIVAPSEELVFKFFIPLLLMVSFGLNYLVGGIIAGVAFLATGVFMKRREEEKTPLIFIFLLILEIALDIALCSLLLSTVK